MRLSWVLLFVLRRCGPDRFFLHRVSHHENLDSVDHPDSLPARLTFNFAVLRRYKKWIVKDQDRQFETYAVLAPIVPVLTIIPGEFHNAFVDTNLYIQ